VRRAVPAPWGPFYDNPVQPPEPRPGCPTSGFVDHLGVDRADSFHAIPQVGKYGSTTTLQCAVASTPLPRIAARQTQTG
jgi:hypothetical protein